MSGICGIIRFDGRLADPVDLERQTRAMAHRGPDRVRRWRDGSVGLAHLLMRTQTEDIHDEQPLHDGPLSLVCDARIDNRETIAAELGISAEALASMADSALVLAAYKAWGKACADRLIGDFLFAVYDRDARTLIMARDPMGQRHCFVHSAPGFFAFASEKKGLWALPDVPRVLPDEAILKQMMMSEDQNACDPRNPPPDRIAAIPGGRILTLGPKGELDLEQYWTPQADPIHLGRDEAYYVETYRKVLGEAVACRVRRATRPPGILFSGGFDSTSIVALAGPTLTARGHKFVAAASVMPPAYHGPFLDARPWVEICERFMPHLDVRYVTGEGIDILTGLDQAITTNDAAPSPNRYVNDALYRAVAQSGARICMDGHGGDYTLNPSGGKALLSHLLRGRLRLFSREWRALRDVSGHSHGRIFAGQIVLPAVPSLFTRFLRLRAGGIAFGVNAPVSKLSKAEARTKRVRQRRPRWLYSKRAGMIKALVSLHSAYQLGGAVPAALHGLEFTQPFHDRRVVELGLAIPEEYDLKDGRDRYLARTALADLLPLQFQESGKRPDLRGPDFADMIERLTPQLLAEIDRMEAGGKLSRYFDFAKMRKMFLTRPKTKQALQNPQHYLHAVRAFQMARYIEWFRGYNS